MMFGYFLRVFVAIALAVVFIYAMVGTSRGDTDEHGCASIDTVQATIDKSTNYWHLRRVEADRLKYAVRMFDKLTGQDDDWTFAMLADNRDGGGVILVGYGERVCYYRLVDRAHWDEVALAIEGVKA